MSTTEKLTIGNLKIWYSDITVDFFPCQPHQTSVIIYLLFYALLGSGQLILVFVAFQLRA